MVGGPWPQETPCAVSWAGAVVEGRAEEVGREAAVQGFWPAFFPIHRSSWPHTAPLPTRVWPCDRDPAERQPENDCPFRRTSLKYGLLDLQGSKMVCLAH